MTNSPQRPLVVVTPRLYEKLHEEFGAAVDVVSTDDWRSSLSSVLDDSSTNDCSVSSQEILAAILTASETSIVDEQVRKLSETMGFPILRSDTEATGATNLITSQLVERLEATRAALAKDRAAAALLRREMDVLSSSFLQLDHYVGSLGIPKFVNAFSQLPSNGVLWVGNGASIPISLGLDKELPTTFRQRIPISSTGMVAIDLHLPFAPVGSTGDIQVSVLNLAEQCLGTCHLENAAALPAGWHRFLLNRTLGPPEQDMEIAITPSGDLAIPLSLSSESPFSQLRLCDEGGRELTTSSLAVRIWRGIPGSKLPDLHGTSDQPKRNVLLRALDAPLPELLRCDEQLNFDAVNLWREKQAILVHPPQAGVTIASVPRVRVSNLKCLTGLIANGNSEGPAIDFAIGIRRSSSPDFPCDSLSRWVTLTPMAWGEVQHAIEEQVSGEIDLILATRVSGNQSNKMAWALFSGFRLHCD